MVEVVVAITILTVVLVAVAGSALVSLRAVTLGRQRTTANSLASQSLEQLRALPFATVAKGLDDTDLRAAPIDAAITRVGTAYTFNGETLPHGNIVTAGTTLPPLVPHRSTQTTNGVAYTVATYVTQVAGSTGVVRATVVVSWGTSSTPGAAHSVTSSTLLAAPTGCLAGSNHPYVAPCQAFLYASGGTSGGHVTLNGTVGNITIDDATLTFASVVSNLQAEQITADNGAVTATGGALTIGGATQRTGGASQTVHSDDDPASTASGYSAGNVTSQPSGALSRSDGAGNSIVVAVGGGDSGSAAATSSADATTARCTNIAGIAENDHQPCGAGTVRAGAASSLVVSVAGVTGSFVAAQLANPATQSGVFVARDVSPDSGACSGTSGDGCATAAGARSLGAFDLAGLPVGFQPGSGWDGALVHVSAYSDTVGAEAGLGAARPSLGVVGTPTVRWWNGAGYTTTTLTASTVGAHLAIPAATATDPVSGYHVTMTADIALGGVTTSDPSGCGSTVCTRASASAVAASPIIGSVDYVITDEDGNLVASFTVAADLGTNRVDCAYQAAPSSAP